MRIQWIETNYTNLPCQLEEDRLTYLVKLLRSGKAEIHHKEELINGHLRLIISLVSKIVARKKYNREVIEDVLGEASVALVEAIEAAPTALYDDNLTKYIISSVVYKIKAELSKFSQMRMPVRTLRYKLANGINKLKTYINDPSIPPENLELLKKLPIKEQSNILEQAKVMSIGNFKQLVRETIHKNLSLPNYIGTVIEDVKIDYDQPSELTRTTGGDLVPESRKDKPALELLEALWKSAENPIEKAILELRMEGYTYQEIGPKVGYSFVRVGEIVREMEIRFHYYWGD